MTFRIDGVEPAISIQQLTKRYRGGVMALNGVTLDVPAGCIYGFLGPNGAGKTTALRALVGMLHATSGKLRVLGLDPWRERVPLHERLGYLPSGMGVYEQMTGRDLLDYCAGLLHGPGRASPLRARALEALALEESVLDRHIRSYSRGMRQKVAIVQAVQHDPELLLLDEPSEGLDPLVQHSFYQLLRERREQGRTVFFSSHTLSEVQALCDRIAIIRAGTLVVESTYEQLQGEHPRVVRITTSTPREQVITQLGDGWREVASGDSDTIVLHASLPPVEIVRQLAQLSFDDVTIEQPSLEDIFLSYYGEEG